MQPTELKTASDRQYRSLIGVWCVFVVSQAGFFGLCALVAPNDTSAFLSNFSWPIALLGLTFVVDSFVWKRRVLALASKKHNPSEVNRAYIMALALCEAAPLFGVMLRFEADFRYYYALIALGALAMLVHFPRKDHVLASYEIII